MNFMYDWKSFDARQLDIRMDCSLSVYEMLWRKQEDLSIRRNVQSVLRAVVNCTTVLLPGQFLDESKNHEVRCADSVEIMMSGNSGLDQRILQVPRWKCCFDSFAAYIPLLLSHKRFLSFERFSPDDRGARQQKQAEQTNDREDFADRIHHCRKALCV